MSITQRDERGVSACDNSAYEVKKNFKCATICRKRKLIISALIFLM